jgi:hypothetical protein
MTSGLSSFGSGYELVTVENKIMNLQVPNYSWNFLSVLATVV